MASADASGAAEGTRTPAYSLASCRTTPILRPLIPAYDFCTIYSTGFARRQARATRNGAQADKRQPLPMPVHRLGATPGLIYF
jgi:hypothetical protein